MTQVDLDTLVTDRKIAVAGDEKPAEEEDESTKLPPDFPPESFWLSKDAEYDWFDRNAFLDRKESTKGNSNFYSNVFPSTNSSSQRFSSNLKSKTGILGLPKTQKTAFTDPSNRRISKHANISLFPKRSESMAKSAVTVLTEPSSPNVSCIGRVRSKKGRRRRSKSKDKNKDKNKEPDKDKDKDDNAVTGNEVEKSRSNGGGGKHHQNQKNKKKKKKKGIYMRIVGIFRSERKQKKVEEEEEQQSSSSEEKKNHRKSSAAVNEVSAVIITTTCEPVPPGLGGMKRFTSGRRSTSSLDEDASKSNNRQG